MVNAKEAYLLSLQNKKIANLDVVKAFIDDEIYKATERGEYFISFFNTDIPEVNENLLKKLLSEYVCLGYRIKRYDNSNSKYLYNISWAHCKDFI